MSNGVALVTGASSGIGAATAIALSEAGFTVHGAARRVERIPRLGGAITPWTLDVCDADEVRRVTASIGPVDLLVNNAGLGGTWEPLATTDYADIERTVSTNVTAAIHVVQQVLAPMTERGNGHIINVGSMAGLYPLPAALYGATKAAIHRLSTNLRLELVGTGVRVTEICPGRVRTEFYDAAIADEAIRASVKETGADEVTAAECADTIVYAATRPRHVNVNRIELQPVEQTYGGSQFVLEDR